MTTAIIADDEHLLVDHLQRQLAVVWPALTIVGVAANGPQALQLIHQHRPDIAFLDIRMPGMTGLEVARELATHAMDTETNGAAVHTRIVFVTAFDQYAVAAFEAAATDYLLKPVSEARLRQCVNRLVDRPAMDLKDITRLLSDLTSRPIPAPPRLRWLRVGLAETTRLIDVDDVLFFQSESKYTTVATRLRDDVLRMTIRELEEALDPEQFWRVHRGTIVNVRAIVEARRDLRGRFVLKIQGRNTSLRTSEAYAHRFRLM